MAIEDQLLAHDEPIVRYLTRVLALGEDPDSRSVQRERARIPKSPMVRTLLSEVGRNGLIKGSPYSKWRGSHWVMAFLSELGYPPGDKKLKAMADRNVEW